jgi:hypothetical protein
LSYGNVAAEGRFWLAGKRGVSLGRDGEPSAILDYVEVEI